MICDDKICISDHYTSGSVNFNGLLGLQNDTAEKILYKLGYNKIQKEIWVEINQNL